MVDLWRPPWPNRDSVKGVAGYTTDTLLNKRSLRLTGVIIRLSEANYVVRMEEIGNRQLVVLP
jgi:hypothetical protein